MALRRFLKYLTIEKVYIEIRRVEVHFNRLKVKGFQTLSRSVGKKGNNVSKNFFCKLLRARNVNRKNTTGPVIFNTIIVVFFCRAVQDRPGTKSIHPGLKCGPGAAVPEAMYTRQPVLYNNRPGLSTNTNPRFRGSLFLV